MKKINGLNTHKEKILHFIKQYTKCIEEKNFDTAYKIILRTCKLSSFKLRTVNDDLFLILNYLNKTEEIFKYILQICTYFLKTKNISELLYYYQILTFFQFKKNICFESELKEKIKTHLYSHRKEIKDYYNLPESIHFKAQKKIKIGYLIGLVAPTHAPTKMLLSELKYLDNNKFDTYIFTTEWISHSLFDKTYEGKTQSGDKDFNTYITENYETKLILGNEKVDFLDRSIEIYKSIIKHNINILVVNSTDAEAVALMISLLKPAQYCINVVHGGNLILNNTDYIIQLFHNNILEKCTIPQEVIPITSSIRDASDVLDIEKDRNTLKNIIEQKKQCIITGTFGNLYKIHNEKYFETISKILKNNEKVIHIIAGFGDFDKLNDTFKHYNVDKQIIYVGPQKNIKPFIEVLDIYLASFPWSGPTSVLECMAMGKPVISMANKPDLHYNASAEITKLSECVVQEKNYTDYINKANLLISSKKLRTSLGNKLRERFDSYYSPVIRIQSLENVYLKLIQ